MESKKLQKLGGVSSILQGLIYISAFVVYGGVLVFPDKAASALERFNFLSDNYLILSLLNLTSYVFFGILLAILVLAIYKRLKPRFSDFSSLAAVFGFVWVALVIASGMISNIGLEKVLEMGSANPENAMLVWSSVGVVTEGLGGGNEIVGGIWVLLISAIAWKANVFSKPLNFLGVLVGIAGILTIYPLDIFKEIFGLSQILWFLWIGVAIIRKPLEGIAN